MKTSLQIALAGVVLAGFAASGVSLVALTHQATAQRIAANERWAMLHKMHAILPDDRFDNDILNDYVLVHDRDLLGADPIRVYRARKQGKPAALILTPVVPSGYGGPIDLLVSVYTDGTLGGVRVLEHHETPGLGDRIDEDKSDWILGFTGKSLGNPPESQWKVKKDGGVFDQFTGATITPRSVVKAVKNALIYVKQHQKALFSAPSAATKEEANRHE